MAIIRYILLIFQLKAWKKLKTIDRHSKLLSQIIYNSINFTLSFSEREEIKKIETLRKQLLKSKQIINVKDFGAGNKNNTHSKEESEIGVEVPKIIGKICKHESKSQFWTLILYNIIKEFKLSCGIELGTNLGLSAIYQLTAFKNNANTKFTTIEGSPELVKLATKHIKQFEFNNYKIVCGKFNDKLVSELDELIIIDYAFIDGHHDGDATISYFYNIIPYLNDFAIIIFDDISWSNSMKQAWKSIIKHENICLSLNFHQMGVCVLDKNKSEAININLFLI